MPGDKSISHRAIILELYLWKNSDPRSLESEDVFRTIKAMEQFGATIIKKKIIEVDGFGVGGFSSLDSVIDCNSGTTCRTIRCNQLQLLLFLLGT